VRFVKRFVRAEQAAYRAQWRAVVAAGSIDDGDAYDHNNYHYDHEDDAADTHPYTALGTVALTTPAGSWLVHRDDLAARVRLLW
jgi:hypothetical protein